ncbi:hypothetical protein [Suipraeoptans intestinalis]|uniref:hypothetical protein n=1 Tax=Suipraeoptans intestinalis TaxID=2606628 RepID=UPI0012B1F2B8|nr:hypothetical protein [Suipraeoptans intestinalis]
MGKEEAVGNSLEIAWKRFGNCFLEKSKILLKKKTLYSIISTIWADITVSEKHPEG